MLRGWTIAIYHRRNPVKPNISVTNITVEWKLLMLRIRDIPRQQKKHPARFFTIFVSITQTNPMTVGLPQIRSWLFPSKSPPMHYLTAVLRSTLHSLINNNSLNKPYVNIFYKLRRVVLETSGVIGWVKYARRLQCRNMTVHLSIIGWQHLSGWNHFNRHVRLHLSSRTSN